MNPALTAEEWQRKEVNEGKHRWGGNVYADEDTIDFDDGIDPQHGAGFRERRHAVAALALWEQTYGFTWDDVDRHEVLAKRAETRWLLRRDRAMRDGGFLFRSPEALRESDEIDAERRWHESMAARIAALLPPREPVPPQQPSEQHNHLRQ